MKFTLYTASCVGKPWNSIYPHRVVITNAEEMMVAIAYDHVCAEYKNAHRSVDDFLSGDVDVMDCDNDHTDNPDDWITPEMYETIFPDVAYVVVPSRNNMKPKGSKSARPRHHVYFMHSDLFSAEDCAALKRKIYEAAPFFDGNALDAGRFIFGSPAGKILWHEGSRTIEDFLEEQDFEDFDREQETIGEGSRNSTMSRIAACIIKRYGNTDEAYQLYLKKSELCDPPLEQDELDTIWSSAVKFGKKVSQQEGYIPPEEYGTGWGLKPDDYSDIGQAKVLARDYEGELVYTDATDYMRYDGTRWVESKQMAVGACEEFLDSQLAEAQAAIDKAKAKLLSAGVSMESISAGGKTLEKAINGNSILAYNDYCAAAVYQKFVMKRRDMKYIQSALQAAKPMLLKDIKEFDSQEFLLNTPGGVYCLTEGLSGRREHTPGDYITKITAVSPDSEGMDVWLNALDTFFCGNAELIDYVQQTVGLAAIGKVYQEAMIIAYGDGRNGKSTFWNAIAKVLGSYSGALSAEALTVGVKRNVKPEMAEIKGKRLIIAAELEEGMRLNTSVVKQLCSTDEIAAEEKYKDPFKYTPTHTLVLYTNHLPKVGANDEGTWRRLIVIPFLAKIEGKPEVKNFAEHLVQTAGGAILTWIIEGAKKAIDCDFRLKKPQVVEDAISEYRDKNNWLGIFLEDCCEVDASYTQKSGELYQEYRAYCDHIGEYTRSTTDFYTALENAGFKKKKTRVGAIVEGIRLKSDFLEI